MKTKTELKIEYAFLSWAYEFPQNVEDALEDDYAARPHLYSNETLKQVAALLLIAPDSTPEQVLNLVASSQPDMRQALK